ncbi:hypothetical protein MO387_08295 [Shewanella sp. N2AIL]|uniref:hypothetical protein n=1 Tax=Shewanella TaxID=22 RepID=UPI000D35C918|nr:MULTISPECIES: hypothetical protein [Shewanella]MCI2963090.1 hypothetical protein [Shewanella sp. N2AIL]
MTKSTTKETTCPTMTNKELAKVLSAFSEGKNETVRLLLNEKLLPAITEEQALALTNVENIIPSTYEDYYVNRYTAEYDLTQDYLNNPITDISECLESFMRNSRYGMALNSEYLESAIKLIEGNLDSLRETLENIKTFNCKPNALGANQSYVKELLGQRAARHAQYVQMTDLELLRLELKLEGEELSAVKSVIDARIEAAKAAREACQSINTTTYSGDMVVINGVQMTTGEAKRLANSPNQTPSNSVTGFNNRTASNAFYISKD